MNKRYYDKLMELADKAYKNGDIPISAILVKDGSIEAQAFNTREVENNILGHAEINAILQLSKKIQNWNLNDYDLYVTLKPCTMCQSIIKQCRINKVYYLLEKPDSKKEYDKTEFVYANEQLYRENYSMKLSEFFKELREKNNNL